ncbi:transporter substrate-binding domain-containing diguanylate cyclase [Hyphococcus sp.]|uniref:GGDEF domain-containing protein n=1 Tax=Hyphococcus sp. TaxID=2038636 RepID=UPI003CCBCFEE
MQNENGVTPKARIVYIGGAEEDRLALTLPFTDAGYALVSERDGAAADLGLIDLRGKRLSAKKAQTIANLLRRKSPESTVIIAIDPYLDAPARQALRRHGELVVIGAKPDALIARCRQILRLRNIAEEAGERLKTLASLSRLNEFPPIAAPPSPLRVLIAGAPGAVTLAAVNALRPITEQCVCVFSAGQAMRAVDNARFDCAIFLPARENDPLLSVVKALRRHPRHNSLPMLFPLHDADDAEIYTKRGAADFIMAGHVSADLAAKAQLAARRARLLKTMRRFLNVCEGDNIRDATSGAFTPAFLSEHGARLCARADQTDRPMSLIALRIVASACDTGEPETGRRALHQAARIINRVTRAEDTTARIASDTFLVLAPATTQADAQQAGMRIKGVMENTVFRSADNQQLYGVKLETAAIARPSGFCIEECVALSLKAIQENRAVKPLSQQFLQ